MAGALSASSSGRFSNVDAVVSAKSALTVGSATDPQHVDPHPRPPLAVGLVARVAAVDGVAAAVGDVTFSAESGRLSAPAVRRSFGHGWASRTLTPYALVAGRGPRAGEIAVEQRLGAGVGEHVRVSTPAGARTFRVSGLVDAHGKGDRTQAALFFADATASRLALRPGLVDAVGVLAAPGVDPALLRHRLQAALGKRYAVSGRDDASTADAGDPRADQRDEAVSVMAILAANGAVVTIFVVAGIFGLAVAQRRRELALLRAVGATPRQVRRMIAAEAFLVAVVAGIAGCIAGVLAAGPIATMLVDRGIAPEGLRPHAGWVPLLVAFASGILVSEAAVLAAASRAGRVRAGEALRDASLGRERLGLLRGALGLLTVGGAIVLLLAVHGLATLAAVVPLAIMLAAGAALLAPVVLALPAGMLSRPLRGLGPSGLLASTSIATGRRRVGAVSASIALVVAIAGSQIVLSATSRAAARHETGERVLAAQALVSNGAGLPPRVERAAGRLPGATGAVGVIPLDIYVMNRDLVDNGTPKAAAGLDVPHAAGLLDLRVRDGSLAGVGGRRVAISTQFADENGLGVGDTLRVRLPDGAQVPVRVGATYRLAAALGDLVLPAALARRHASTPLDEAIFVGGHPDREQLRQLASQVPTAEVVTRSEYLRGVDSSVQHEAWVAWLVVFLIAAYAAISIVNTAAVAVADRRREFRLARLVGSTRGQVMKMVAWEAAVTSIVGLAAGAAIVAAAVWRVPATQPGWHIVVPHGQGALLLVGTGLLAIAAAVVPTLVATRRPVGA
jgi:putative ABC transport system permease protein